MTMIIKITEDQFTKLRQKIGINVICANDIQFIGFVKVIHMEGSSKYTPKGYDDWSDYWRKKVKTPITPTNNICDCCCQEKENFVIGHVTRIDNGDNFLYPICDECNGEGKGNGNHPFLASETRLHHFNFSDAVVKND